MRYPYVYRWNRPDAGNNRKGHACAVTARSARGKGVKNFNSIRVEFPDGFKMITSGNAIRRAQEALSANALTGKQTRGEPGCGRAGNER